MLGACLEPESIENRIVCILIKSEYCSHSFISHNHRQASLLSNSQRIFKFKLNFLWFRSMIRRLSISPSILNRLETIDNSSCSHLDGIWSSNLQKSSHQINKPNLHNFLPPSILIKLKLQFVSNFQTFLLFSVFCLHCFSLFAKCC
jgi:hypothetical protein